MKLLEKELTHLSPDRDSVLSVGVFDGVHLGHRELLGRLTEVARKNDFVSIVITFRQNPKAVLNGGPNTTLLTNLDDRIQLIKSLGVDTVTALSFTANLVQTPAFEFIGLLQKHLRMRGMVVGPDFALGRNREGNIEKLRFQGIKMGFFLEVVPPVLWAGNVVSSTAIRQALLQGDMPKVNGLLGRRFSLHGIVEQGTGKGKELGFPTANIRLNPENALPADGVYSTRAYVNNNAFPSVSNIGFAPTLGVGVRRLEVYLLDFEGDLYRKDLKVEFIERLREEKKFTSVGELRQQVMRDIQTARASLSK